METFVLNNNTTIPALGLGTFTLTPDEAQKSVEAAISDGYTLIDTANAYLNEKAVGRGIKASGARREDLYISTKLWPSIYGKAAQAIDETLELLQVSYVDLLFLHQPVGDVETAYKAMEDAVKAGKVRSIGLSNFPIEECRKIVEQHEIKPAMVQIEAHPYYQQKAYAEFLKSFGGRIMSWYPLGHGDKSLINEEIFSRLGAKYHKSNAQIILRWHVQTGYVVIPGSRNPEHIRDNFNIFDFRLSDEEMAEISSLEKGIPYYRSTPEQLAGYVSYAPDFNAQK